MSRMSSVLFIVVLLLIAASFYFMSTGGEQSQSNTSESTDTVPQKRSTKKARREGAQDISEKAVLSLINNFRTDLGVSALQVSATLSQVAATRIFDMKDREYFGPVSPLGETVQSVSSHAGYRYIHIDENRIKGRFLTLSELTERLFDPESDVPRVLSAGYTEIGISLGSTSENEQLLVTVLAVPMKACPQVNPVLLDELEKNKQLLLQLGVSFEELQDEEPAEEESFSPEISELIEVTTLLNTSIEEATESYESCLRAFNESVASARSGNEGVRSSATPSGTVAPDTDTDSAGATL